MRILIGVDGSPQASAGVRWVSRLPLRPTDEVIVVAVAQEPVLLGAWSWFPPAETEAHRQREWVAVEEAAQRAVASAAEELEPLGCGIRTLVAAGYPADVLVRLAREEGVDLVVVGPHGLGALDRIILGSVSSTLLQAMPAPVLVAREPVTAPATVLLAADGSAQGLDAARYLARFPLPSGARVVVVAVTHDRVPVEGSTERPGVAGAVDATVAILVAGGIACSSLVRHGGAKQELLGAAVELGADLIVTGARGLGGFQGMILGSVSRGVAKAATCSVLVVGDPDVHRG